MINMKHPFMMLVLILLINYLICYYLSQYIYATSRRIDNNKVLVKFIHYPYLTSLRFITSIVVFFLYLKFAFSIEFWVGVFLLYIVTIISFIDYNYYIIPDRFNLVILILGLCLLSNSVFNETSIQGRIYGLASMVIISILLILFMKYTHKEIIGGGDLKLITAISLLIGWQNALCSIFVASIIALLIYPFWKTKRKLIPFGPFLSLSFMIIYLYGSDLIRLYLRLLK